MNININKKENVYTLTSNCGLKIKFVRYKINNKDNTVKLYGKNYKVAELNNAEAFSKALK